MIHKITIHLIIGDVLNTDVIALYETLLCLVNYADTILTFSGFST